MILIRKASVLARIGEVAAFTAIDPVSKCQRLRAAATSA